MSELKPSILRIVPKMVPVRDEVSLMSELKLGSGGDSVVDGGSQRRSLADDAK